MTAGFPNDFTAVNETVIFEISDRIKTIPVFIHNDYLVEGNEEFILRLTTDDEQVIISQNKMTITIRDDDGK